MSDIIVPSLMQLVGQSPVLLVYLVGMILALVFWRRYPSPCLLVLIATVLLLLVTVSQTFVTQYLFLARAEMDWTHERFGWMLSAVGLTGNILRALGFGLLLAAVFLGRTVALRAGPAIRPSEEQGITSRPGG